VINNNLDSAAYCLKRSVDIALQSKKAKEPYIPELLEESCHNLVLVYINRHEKGKAMEVIQLMNENDIPVSQDLMDLTTVRSSIK
jgi:hypothetical protein